MTRDEMFPDEVILSSFIQELSLLFSASFPILQVAMGETKWNPSLP